MKKNKTICVVFGLLLSLPFTLFSQTIPFGAPINGASTNESNPCLNGNGRTIVFESSYDATDKPILAIGYQKGGVWSKPVELKGATNNIPTLTNNGGFFLNNNANLLLFNSKIHGGVGDQDIWIMEKTSTGVWSTPENLGAPINSTLPDTDPSVSPDGKYLFFTRLSTEKTPNGNACGKLYIAESFGKNSWKNPVAMPAPINMGCECAGRMLADNKTFLFASMRKGGLGGYDIYKTTQKSDGSWETPVPFTFVNTAKDDKYISVPAVGSLAYTTGIDKAGGFDIVKSRVPDEFQPDKITLIQGNVKDAATKLVLLPKVIVTNTTTNKSTTYIGGLDGSYTAGVPQDNAVYDVAIIAYDNAEYIFNSLLFFPPQSPKFEEKTVNVALSSKKASKSYPLNNIAFVNNSDTIQTYSSAELTRLFILLKANATMKIEIGVHINEVQTDSIFRLELTATIIDSLEYADSTGQKFYSLKTTYSSDNTVRQAKMIASILVKKGIPANRISAKGYGNSQPLTPPPADAILNKRVEFKIMQ